MAERRPPPEHVTLLVHGLFSADEDPRFGPYEFVEGGADTLIDGTLYHFEVIGPTKTSMLLQVFTEIAGDLAGRLWRQEIRVLLRLSGEALGSLPVIHGGGYDEESKVAWIVTSRWDQTLHRERGWLYFQQHKAEAARHFVRLADALATLHGHGMFHRNIWPDAILVEDDRGSELRLVLGRFETSTMLGNLLRSTGRDPGGRAADARRMLREQEGALPYFPPERLRYLLADEPGEIAETDRGDVFGLGAIVYEWFVGGIPAEELVDPRAEGAEFERQLAAVHAEMRRRTRRSDLPSPLRDLVEEMLRADPRQRPTSADVVKRLVLHYDAFLEPLEAEDERTEGARLILYRPDKMVMPEQWGWTPWKPSEPAGAAELTRLIEEDLHRAILVHSPEGAEPFAGHGDAREMRLSTSVLIGDRAAWFCHPFQLETGSRLSGWRAGPILDDVLIIRYPVLIAHKERELVELVEMQRGQLQRRVGRVEVRPAELSASSLDQVRAGRPKWTPLLVSVHRGSQRTADDDFLSGLRWLLDLQSAEHALQEYAFERVTADPTAEWVELCWAPERDAQRAERDHLYAFLAPGRMSFGDFAVSDRALEAKGVLEFVADEGGQPAWQGGVALEVRRQDADQILIRRSAAPSAGVPDRGWLRPGDARGTLSSIARQRDALRELRRRPGLVSQLQEPWALQSGEPRWAHAAAQIKGLRGDARSNIAKMLASEPFFALHGPPGTGKTTLVAHAVDVYLAQERGARVLIAAQANFALDNLARGVLEQLEARDDTEVLALRVGRDSPASDPWMREWRIQRVTERLAQWSRDRAAARLGLDADEPTTNGERQASEGVGSRWRPIFEEWLHEIGGATLELQDRVERGANVVFATTSGSYRRALDRGPFATFDWVIVEEVAKAWPTEVAIPLVRGVRWTLVGDHRQLPAYRRDDVRRVLDRLREDGWARGLAEDAQRGDAYERAFDFFRHLFDKEHRGRRPVVQLQWQYRMRSPIADVVSKAFYESVDDPPLLTDGEAEGSSGVTSPRRLANLALAWIDTTGAGCGQKPRWRNAGEAQIVARLVERLLTPAERGDREQMHERLAILSPWRHQCDEIRHALASDLGTLVHTVDSFQGREADIVIVSLVRDAFEADAPSWRNLGHAIDEHRINVMLSRARRLSLIVGRFEQFARSGVDFWSGPDGVCSTMHGVVIPVAEVLDG